MHWGAMRSSRALGLTIGLKPWAPAADIASEQGRLIASGALAKALDSQLASNQPQNARVRIGLSFRDREGRYCRSFDSGALAGKIGRGSGRERGCPSVKVSGVAVSLKKKQQ